MNRNLAPHDAPKIALALALLLALGSAGFLRSRNASSQHEQHQAAEETARLQREADPNFVH